MLLILNDLIFDKRLTDNDVMVYAFLKIQTYSENYESCLFNVAEIIDQIYGEINSHSTTANIVASLNHLMDAGYIVTKKRNQSTWHIFMSSYNITTEDRFTLVNPDYLRTIMDSEYRKKPSIARFYMALMSTVYKESKAGIYDYSWFADKMGISTATVSRYLKCLEELKVVYVYRAADFYISNTYGAYSDLGQVRHEGEKRSSKHEAHKNANEKRKYVAMYQQVIEGKEYDVETLKEILDVMQTRNNSLKDLGANARGKFYDLQPLIDKINHEC